METLTRYCRTFVTGLGMRQAARTLHWRHNDHDGVSNHQPHDCLLNRLFRRRSKKTSKLRVTGLCMGKSPGPVNSPHKGPVTWKMFPFDDVIMTNGSIGISERQQTDRLDCYQWNLLSVVSEMHKHLWKCLGSAWFINCILANVFSLLEKFVACKIFSHAQLKPCHANYRAAWFQLCMWEYAISSWRFSRYYSRGNYTIS